MPNIKVPIYHIAAPSQDEDFYKNYYPIPTEGAKRLLEKREYRLKCLLGGVEFVFNTTNDLDIVIQEELFGPDAQWFIWRYSD